MVNQGWLYLDASALVKLVLAEAESEALRAYLSASRGGQLTSIVSAVELPRAVGRAPNTDPALVEVALEHIGSILLDPEIVRRAAYLDPAALRSLDAIHLASALAVGSELVAFVTYDERLASAARAHGLPVAAPA